MRPTPTLASLAAIALLAGAMPALAEGSGAFIDPAQIDRAVEQFTGAPIGVAGGAARPVDRRLRLAQCRSPLALGWHGTRQDAVRVECPDSGSWRIFVAIGGGGTAGPAARMAPLVARGDAVSIVVRGPGFSVTQSGEALETGAQGEWIRVRPPGGSEPLRAQVARPGQVVIPL